MNSYGAQHQKILGQVNLPVNLNGLTLSHHFLVVDHLMSDILIGLDFLSFSNAVLDLF